MAKKRRQRKQKNFLRESFIKERLLIIPDYHRPQAQLLLRSHILCDLTPWRTLCKLIVTNLSQQSKRNKQNIIKLCLLSLISLERTRLKPEWQRLHEKPLLTERADPMEGWWMGFSLINVSFPRKEKFFVFFDSVSLSNNKEMLKQIKT